MTLANTTDQPARRPIKAYVTIRGLSMFITNARSIYDSALEERYQPRYCWCGVKTLHFPFSPRPWWQCSALSHRHDQDPTIGAGYGVDDSLVSMLSTWFVKRSQVIAQPIKCCPAQADSALRICDKSKARLTFEVLTSSRKFYRWTIRCERNEIL